MRLIILCCSIFLAFNLQAQHKLVFTKSDSSKVITVNQKDLIKLSFDGYLLQPQVAEGVVTSLTDSSVTLLPRKKLFRKNEPSQIVLIRDITGFRRYSKFRPAGEIIYGIVGIGIAGTITTVIANASIPAVLGFLSGAATGALTAGLKGVFFSTKVKNMLNNGWTMQLQPQ